MDPSIMKLLEEDEDESMHSGADVDAFTSTLNRDIGGDPFTVSQPSEPESVGVLSQESASELKQLTEQWQASEDGNPGQQNQQNEQKLHLQSSEQHSSQMELKDQESSVKNQEESINSQPEQLQLQKGQPHSNHQQQETGQTSHQLVGKDQVEIPEQDPVHSSQLDRPPSESQQQQTVQQLHSQQGSAGNDGNNSMRRMKPSPSIPFHMLIPILRPHLDKDRSMQLQSVFSKLRSNEVSKEDFLRVIRNIVGDQMLRQAAHKVQLQMQTQSARNLPMNSNQYSLQAQAASQQLSSRASQKLAETQVPSSHPTSSSSSLQDHKGQKSPPRQPHIPSSSIQLQTDTSFQTFDSSQKSREIEHNFDGKGTHSSPIYSTNMNLVNSERETLMASLQNTNKQQHAQPPQPSFSMYGSTGGNFHSHAFPRPTVSSAASSLKQQTQTPQLRQVSQTQGMVSMHLGTSKPMNMANVHKYDLQNAASETKRLHSGSLTNHPLSQKSPVAWPPLANKENNRAFPQIGYVKQEVVDQAAEPSQKFQFTASEGSSFSSMHEQGNQNLGSTKDDRLEKQASRMGFSAPTSISGANPVSGAATAQVDPTLQMHPHMSSTIPSLSGPPMRTPSKKPSVGQKKPLEALGTSPPPSNKKQKTSGAFLDQSIEQLNDVTAVSGVNLREEEEQLLSAPKEESRASEATRRVVQEEEERLILHKGPLQKKLADIMSQCGLEGISGDVERCLSMCVEERLRGFISYMIRLSKQRADIEKTRHKYVTTSDVRRHILLMNRKAKDEWDRKQAEEAEKHRKLNESESNAGADTDKEKDDGRSKNIKVNKEEDDKMRTTAANVAARAAVGGDDMLSKWQLMAEQARQKREGLEGASSSQPSKTTNSKPMPGMGRNSREHQETHKKGHSAASGGNGTIRKLGRHTATSSQPKVSCNISVKDVIAALEREPQMSKSTLIYRLYDRLGGDPAAE